MEFSERLKELIKDSQISKYKLAKILKCSKQTVCNWCDGITEPNLNYIRQIAIYFNTNSDYLLGLENEDGTKNYNNTYNNFGTHKGDVNF